MLFNSYTFFLYFPIVTALFFLLPHRYRWFHLLSASIFFYMAFLPVYVLILVVTIIVDYFAGLLIAEARGRRRKMYLILSLIVNIGFLCFFKYYDFCVENLNSVLNIQLPFMNHLWLSKGIIEANNWVNTNVNRVVGTDLQILQHIVLPIGLSFHTFQAMSYTIEVYRGAQKPERHFGIYALYVMFYPQLVAGPIERPQNILHQFHERKYFNWENLIAGLRLMVWGLFKKVVIADRLAVYVNLVFDKPGNYHWLNLALAVVFFAIQIYCDFSGYSDMAIGAAKVMGYDLMVNFRRPYFATNIKQFWDRWHISLSTWFRDYVYITLGGNRHGFYRQLLNLTIVFLLSGFWHGANWTFIIWGALHAIYSVGYMLFSRSAKERKWSLHGWFWQAGSWLLTFVLVCFAWIFFRATSVEGAFSFIRHLLSADDPQPFKLTLLTSDGSASFGLISLLIILVSLSIMILVEKRLQPRLVELNRRPVADITFLTLTSVWIILCGLFVNESFIYFQF